MELIRVILRLFMDGVRDILSRPDERGHLTSDLLRLKIREKVRRLIHTHGGFLLDIGCKEGLLYEGLLTEQNMLKIVGVDTDHEILSCTHKIFRKRRSKKPNFVNACAQSLPFRDQSMDIAVCINTFYNFTTKEEVVQAIKEMMRVCKQDGFLIFDIRNKRNPLVYFGFKWVRLYDNRDVILRAYTMGELREALHSIGMVVKETIPVGFPTTTFAPVILVKAEYRENT